MILRRLIAAVQLVALACLSFVPVETVYAAAIFSGADTQSYVRNITKGDSAASTSTVADPGDTISLYFRVRNSGDTAATQSFLSVPLDSKFTYIPHSTRVAWNGASNSANSSTGAVYFAPLYRDVDGNNAVSAGDIRVNWYGFNAAATSGKYIESTTVAGGDADVGGALSSAVSYVYLTGGNATFDAGEKAYLKGTGNTTNDAVQAGDIRINQNGSYIPGSIVVAGDTDICAGCLTQASGVKRLGSNTTLWPFADSGMPLGDVGNAKQFIVKQAQVTVASDSGPVIQTTASVSASGVSAATGTSTLTVDTTPSIAAAAFSPSAIANNGSATTTITAIASDKNGLADLALVSADLTPLGGDSAVQLFDNGTNGDATPNNGIFTRNGISTSVAAGTYSITVTARDSLNQTATRTADLIVQSSDAPALTINSVSPTTVGAAGSVSVAWQSNKALFRYQVMLGSCSGTPVTGSSVAAGDGTTQVLGAGSAVTSVIDNAALAAGANAIFVCGYDADAGLGQISTSATKDVTAPTVSISFLSAANVTTGQTTSITWSANEAGTYSVRAGSCSGTTVTGGNGSGSYTSGTLVSTANAADLPEGSSNIFVCVTDAAGNSGSASSDPIVKDTTPPNPVSNVTLVDNDITQDGVTGADLTISWTAAAADTSFQSYRLFVLPAATPLNLVAHSPVSSSITTQSTTTFTGTGTILNDSAGAPLAAGSYIAHVVVRDSAGLTSAAASSAAATLALDDTSAPTFVSAQTQDANTIRFVFSEPISFVDPAKITIPGATIDTAYSTNGYTGGYRISSGDARQVFIRVQTVATNFTANTAALAACTVRDVTGSSSLNVSGNCAVGPAVTNANAAASNLAITDAAPPTLTLTSPAASGFDNATVAVSYSTSEAMAPASLQLVFTATGGATDSRSPHTIALTDLLVGSSVAAAGAKSFTLNAASFTSVERGAGDSLQNGTIYTVQLRGSDSVNNAATPVSNAGFTFDTTAPAAPVAVQAFGSPTSNTAPTLTWNSVSDAVSYRVEVSLSLTNYSPSFATQTQAGTSWQISPAFSDTGSADGAYIWRVFATDAAGNTSVASNQPTFVLSTQTTTPSLVLQDATSASQTATNSTGIQAVIDGYATNATHYILSESQTTEPLATDPAWVALPGSAPQTVGFTLSAGDGSKTVYAWIRDALNNVSSTAGTANITLDTAALPAPVVAAADANAGSDAGKTNAATVSLTVSGDSGAAAWCVLTDDAADSAPATPGESTCSAPAGGSASGWVTTRPTTATLASTGNKTMYVYLRDSAGNVSSAGTTSIDYQTAEPAAPTLTLTDTVTFSTQFTRSTTVNVLATGTYWRCIVSTSQTSLPLENSASWQSTCPTTIALPASDGLKTVYLWIKDSYGNRYSQQVATSITLDTTAPTFSARRTQDLDGDGQIDAVQITMQEAVLDSSIARANFSIGGGYSLAAFTGTIGTIAFSGGVATGSTVDDAIYYLAVTESGSVDTGATPTIAYSPGTLADRAGNLAASAAATATTDGVSPVRIAADPIRVLDSNANGKADQVRIIYSESLAAPSLTSPWTLANVPSGGSISSVSRATTSVANDTIVLTLTEGSGSIDTTAGSFTAALSNTSGDIKDSANNSALAFTATAGADFMGPVLVSANYIATGTLSSDSIIATFSESVADSSVAIGDFVLAGGGSLSSSSVSTGTAANDASITLANLAGGAPTVGTSTLRLAATGSITDSTAQANASASTATVTIRGGLVINEIAWAGMNSVAADQYIELRNMSATSAISFASDPVALCVGSSSVITLSSGTLAGGGYFLASNFAAGSSQLAVTPDATGFATQLASGQTVSLRSGTSCSAGTVLDSATISGTRGAAGIAMERTATPGDGTQDASWYSAVASIGFDNSTPKGTPKSVNIQDNSAPTFDTATRFPAHQQLLATTPGTIRVAYSDPAGGLGVNTAAVTMEVDLTGNGTFADANEGTAGICSGAALTVTTTGVSCQLPSSLTPGRHSVRVTVADLAGNSSQTSWDFWVDAFTVSMANLDQANLGTVVFGGPAALPNDIARLTRITVQTYGAGVTITGAPSGPLTSGASQIAFPASNNKATLTPGTDTGAWYRVREGASGTFGNYFSLSATPTVAGKSALSASTLAATNALQTYTFYVQYYVDVPAGQAAGVYSHTVNYGVNVAY